jgi:hypothetical protein
LGYSEPDNQLIVNFKPATMMDPSGNGQIKINMPLWWKTTSQQLAFFDMTLAEKCYSDCF